MNENNQFVRFDWAAKRMLRDKANFGVIVGFLTVLLGEKILIIYIMEKHVSLEYIQAIICRLVQKRKMP